MFSIEVEAEPLDTWLTELPGAVQDGLRAKAAALVLSLQQRVTDDKLSGQVLQVKTGALRAAVQSVVSVDGDVVGARVFVDPSVKYAAIQEYGGRTAAHDITPDKARVLALAAGGGTVFARVVHHPGSTIPARSYLRSSLAEMAGEIATELKAAVIAALS